MNLPLSNEEQNAGDATLLQTKGQKAGWGGSSSSFLMFFFCSSVSSFLIEIFAVYMGKKIDDRFHFSCLVGMLIFCSSPSKIPRRFFQSQLSSSELCEGFVGTCLGGSRHCQGGRKVKPLSNGKTQVFCSDVLSC